MTTRSIAPVLPIEVRRQLRDRLWRDVLLRPRPIPGPSTPLQDNESDATEAA